MTESTLTNITAILQDAEGTDYLEEMRNGIRQAIILLEKSKFNQDNEILEKIKKYIIDELSEDVDESDYPPKDCYTIIDKITSMLGLYDE